MSTFFRPAEAAFRRQDPMKALGTEISIDMHLLVVYEVVYRYSFVDALHSS